MFDYLRSLFRAPPPSPRKFADDLAREVAGWGVTVASTEVLGYAQDWLVLLTFRNGDQVFIALDLNGPVFCPEKPITVFDPSRLVGHKRQYRHLREHFRGIAGHRFVLVTDSRVRSEDAIAIHTNARLEVVDGITLDPAATAKRVDVALSERHWL